MVHRDIKPQNLILAREGKKHIVKILDFGLAKVPREKSEDTGLTGEGKMLGTPDYIAPEQSLDAAKADIRADIYSLGCTLVLSAVRWSRRSARTVWREFYWPISCDEAKPLNLVRPEVPEELAAVVAKMMAKSPAKRYQTPMEVVHALSPFVKQGRPKTSPELSVGTTKAAGVKSAEPQLKQPAHAAEGTASGSLGRADRRQCPGGGAAQQWGDPQVPATRATVVAGEQMAPRRQRGRAAVGRPGRHVGRRRVPFENPGRHSRRRCQRAQPRRLFGRRQDHCRMGEGRQACRDPRQAGDA